MFPFDFRIYISHQNKLFFLTLFISRETVSFCVHTSVAKIHSLVRAYFDAFSAPSSVSLVVNHRRVTWSRPTEGMVCLNADGSLLGRLTRHDMVRDINGDFIRGLYGVVAIHILFAKVMAVRHDLQLC
jgi:hypothetical protein